MKIQVVTGSTLYEAAKNVFLSVDKNDLTTPYYVVVPDRFTLQAEKLLFESLNLSSTFNINVVGLSSLANKVFVDEEITRFSTLDGIILIKKILNENSKQFRYFKKENSKLCEELYNTIQQMKSSRLKPEDLVYNKNKLNLANKLHDMKIIYEEYEKQRDAKIDDNDYFEEFASKIEREKLFQNSIFIFAGFDSFTATNFVILDALCKNVKEIKFALPKSESISNAYIYDGDILNKIKALAKNHDFDVEVLSPFSLMNSNQKLITNNLFGFGDCEKQKNDFLFVTNSNTLNEEITFVAKSIKKAIYDGARFNDFMVACPDIEKYAQDVTAIFKNFKINTYLDTCEKLSQTAIARFVKLIFLLSKRNFQKEDLLSVAQSNFIEVENRKALIAFINEKNISGKRQVLNYLIDKIGILKFSLLIKDADTFKNYAEIIEEILDHVFDKHNEFVEYEEENMFIQEASFEKQAIVFMQEVASSLKDVVGEVSLKDFCSIFFTALDAKEISSLPSFCDQVFVGDITSSFFPNTKTVFLLGANAGIMPRSSNDDGLFTDNEIENSCFNKVLEPTIKMINKRNRFKLFSLIAQAEERLVVSYLNFNEEGAKQEKAHCVDSLMKIFDYPEKEVISTNNIFPKDMESLKFCLGTEEAAKKILINLKSTKNKFFNSIKNIFNQNFSNNSRENIERDFASKLMLKNDTIKVTQIENFYDCPFKHFISYALKPTIKQFAEIKPNQIGTIVHNMLEDFVDKYKCELKNVSSLEIEKFLNENLKKYLDNEVIDFIDNKEVFEKEIFLNSKKLCERIVYENKYSKYTPKYLEKRVSLDNFYNNKIKVVGVVDRVDVYEDGFRVIDYKTGKIASSILSSLYYGKKLQLFLYGKAIEKELGLKFKGAFYFDAKTSYSANNPTVLKGAFATDNDNIYALDTRLEDEEMKSDLISAGKKKDGTFNSATMSQPKMSKLMDYAFEITDKAIRQIADGNIKPMPCKNSCQFCEYKGICLYDVRQGERAQKSMESFFKEDQDEI